MRPTLHTLITLITLIYIPDCIISLWTTQVNADGSIPAAFIYGKQVANESWGGVKAAFTEQVNACSALALLLALLYREQSEALLSYFDAH